MRTCARCGCYIPDNWTICPACHLEKTVRFPNRFYRVKVFSDPYRTDEIYETVFNRQEDAFSYALCSSRFSFVKSVEIWDSQAKKCLKIL